MGASPGLTMKTAEVTTEGKGGWELGHECDWCITIEDQGHRHIEQAGNPIAATGSSKVG